MLDMEKQNVGQGIEDIFFSDDSGFFSGMLGGSSTCREGQARRAGRRRRSGASATEQ